ncbi:Bifunctional monothiol glutaredoxin-S16, chloroplastic [Linum grandiflorum]
MAAINLTPLQSIPAHRFLNSHSSQRNTQNISFPKLSISSLPSSVSSTPRRTPAAARRRRCFTTAAAALKSLSDAELVKVPSSQDELLAKFPQESGVYAVHDENDAVQFVGISKNIAASVYTHSKSVPDLCSSVKVGVVEEPDKESLTQAWKSWMEEHIKSSGKVPPGNESGNVTFVRQPPKKKKADLRLTPGRHVQLTVALEELIDRLVKENRVVAFIKGSRSAPMCGFSQKVVGILESQLGSDYESVDVLDEEYNYGLRETLKKYSNWPTFPQVFVGGELLGGCDILTSMYEKGELAGLLKKN